METGILERVWRVGQVAVFCAVLAVAAVLVVDSTTKDADAKKKEGRTTALVHTSTSANTSGSCTYIDHPALNGKVEISLVVTDRNAYRQPNTEALGVYYDSNEKWGICNQDFTPMTIGRPYSVIAAPVSKGGTTGTSGCTGNVTGGSSGQSTGC